MIETSNWYKTIVCDKEEEEETPGSSAKGSDEADRWSFCRWVNFFFYRILVVVIVALIASIVPNINILMTFTGSIFGTIVNILLPTLFYNRAYNRKEKNLKLERPQEDENEDLIKKKEKESKKDDDDNDPRLSIKICSYIVLAVGTIVAIVGLCYVIYTLNEGAEKDEA